MKSIFPVLLFLLLFAQTSFSQSNSPECDIMLDEFDVMIDTLERLTKTYHANPNDRTNRETEKFIQNKNEMNEWYKKWNVSGCLTDAEIKKRFEALEERKRILIKERYGL